MKKILFILLLFTISINAQETVFPIENGIVSHSLSGNIYYKDVNGVLNKFVGTWVYDTPPYYLKVEARKALHQQVLDGRKYKDRLELFYEFKINGEIKYNTIEAPSQIAYTRGNIIRSSNLNKIELNHYEPSLISCWRGKASDLTLNYHNINGIISMTWNRKYRLRMNEGTCDNGIPYDLSDYLIPNNITLIKQ